MVIIGGGITGVGIALDAASRGLKTALVEKYDFASGTSSRSTKLVHGGLRYLKQFEVALVREVGRERAIVHELAPHLVIPEKMLLPIVEDGTFGKFLTSIGLMVYDVLAGVEKPDQREMLSKEETLEHEPLLEYAHLKGGGLYAEYRTDDARLTIEVMKTAAKFGADSINYVEAVEFEYDKEGIVCGITCKDLLNDITFVINADYVVNAAGPWVDDLRQINHSMNEKHLFLTKGVHIVLPHHKFPVQQSIYFDVPDGRMIFAIPRGKVTYVGTTDTEYKGNVNHIIANKEDVDYLLKAIAHTFPQIKLEASDVVSSWAGVRPLIHEEGKSASEISRKDEVFESSTGLISIAGGKLTGYRKMSEKVVDLVVKRRYKEDGTKPPVCQTESIDLCGGETLPNNKAVNKYIQKIYQQIEKGGLTEYDAWYLVSNYGTQSDAIVNRFFELRPLNIAPIALLKAELWFTVNKEMVFGLLDFYMRRTGRFYFDIESVYSSQQIVLEEFEKYFHWSTDKIQQEIVELEQALQEAANFE
ncbi:MAG: glycerol-3-phosphate dehydrogenase/oxidase [Chitinophagales bacterium]